MRNIRFVLGIMFIFVVGTALPPPAFAKNNSVQGYIINTIPEYAPIPSNVNEVNYPLIVCLNKYHDNDNKLDQRVKNPKTHFFSNSYKANNLKLQPWQNKDTSQ